MTFDALSLGKRILSHPKIANSVYNILQIAEDANTKIDAHKAESTVREEMTSLGNSVMQSWAVSREAECAANIKQMHPDARKHSKKNFSGIPPMVILA